MLSWITRLPVVIVLFKYVCYTFIIHY